MFNGGDNSEPQSETATAAAGGKSADPPIGHFYGRRKRGSRKQSCIATSDSIPQCGDASGRFMTLKNPLAAQQQISTLKSD